MIGSSSWGLEGVNREWGFDVVEGRVVMDFVRVVHGLGGTDTRVDGLRIHWLACGGRSSREHGRGFQRFWVEGR